MNQNADNNKMISADEVVTYLKDHADFYKQYPDSLLMMNFSDQPDGSISLAERQILGLRQRNALLEDELHNVTRNAQDNQYLLQQTIGLSLKLIPCNNIAELTTMLFQQLDELFDIKFPGLLLDNRIFLNDTDPSVDIPSIRKILGDNFPNKQPVCGRLKDSEKTALFNIDLPIASAAILPLGEAGELGLLVLGSDNATHFDPAMGDLFLLLIADILSRLLYRYNKQVS